MPRPASSLTERACLPACLLSGILESQAGTAVVNVTDPIMITELMIDYELACTHLATRSLCPSFLTLHPLPGGFPALLSPAPLK